MDKVPEIWVFCEQVGGKLAGVGFELLSKARELKSQRGDGCLVAAVLLTGKGVIDAALPGLSAAGADRVYLVEDDKLADYEANVYVEALSALISRHHPEVVLAGATAIGRAFFARVAVRVGTGLTADCTMLKVEPTMVKERGAELPLLHQTRPAFGGNIMATIMTPCHRPQMATVRPKVFKRVDVTGGVLAEVVREKLTLAEPPTRTVEIRRDEAAVDIAAYEVLVAGGRGLKSAANFAKLFELATALERVTGKRVGVACSRAAVDAGWQPVARQVGQTGKTVAAKLYFCFGISGAIQHLEGIRGCDRIIAVNNDPNAPIFGIANVGVVGDAMQVVDALLEELGR